MPANPLTDPRTAISENQFAPNALAGNKTTHTQAQKQTYAMGAGKDANDIQPGLKGAQGFQKRPDSGSVTATAGTPGTFSGSPVPDDFDDANDSGVKASPTGNWTAGQWVQGNTAAAPGWMHWNGTTWVTGKHP